MKYQCLVVFIALLKSSKQDGTEITGESIRSEIDSHYVLLTPGTFLAGSTNRLCISRLGRATEGLARVQLDVLPANITAQNRYIARFRKNFSEGNGGCFDMVIPKISYTKITLHLRIQFDALPHYEVVTSRTARVLLQSSILTIQPDRSVYRPGDTVKFRLLHLKPDLLPVRGPIRRVWVEPPPVLWTGRARSAQWERVPVQLGLAQLQYVLDEYAPKGEWSIHVQADDSDSEETVETFTVADYTLPTFYLTVHHPKRLLRTTPRATWSICARYMWGEAVRGVLRVRVHGDGGAAPLMFSARLYGDACHNHTIESRRLGFIAAGSDEPTMIVADIAFQEEYTRLWKNATVISRFVEDSAKIEFINKNKMYLSPGLPYKIKLRVTDWDDNPLSSVAVKICREATNTSQYIDPDENSIYGALDTPVTEPCDTIHTDQRGFAQATFNVPAELTSKYYKVQATARTSHTHVVLNIHGGDKVHAALGALGSGGLRNHVPLYVSYPAHREITAPTLHYLLVTRGGTIFRWGATTQCPQPVNSPLSVSQVTLPGMHCQHSPTSRTLLRLGLPARVSHQMCPYSHLLVYFYQDGDLVVATKHFKVSECFYNKVVARWHPSEVPPGGPARLSITSLGPALCATSVTDVALRHTLPSTEVPSLQTQLLNKLRHFIETRKNITLQDYPQRSCYQENHDGTGPTSDDYEYFLSTFSTSGVRIFTDLYPEPTCEKEQQPEYLEKPPKPRERSYFPESWLWSLQLLSSNGSLEIDVTAPDSVTRFDTAVTCVSRSGVSVAQQTVLKVFQPFFVELETPRKIKRGEQTVFFYKIFNNLEAFLAVTVDVETDKGSGITIRGVTGSTPGSHTICVGIHDSYSVRLGVVGNRLGTWRLAVKAAVLPHMQHYCGGDTAQNAYPSDKIAKEIKVETEGQLVEKHHSATLCPEGEGPYGAAEVEWRWEEKDRTVPGSERWLLWVIGDLAGPLNLNSDKLLTLPLGCGEQNMARLAHNLVALKHLELEGRVKEEVKETAVNNIMRGYARQMRYAHPDGGFSAFGSEDVRPSTWLTAFCIRYLRAAQQLLPIDGTATEVAAAEDWLTSLQMENGCFQNVGQVFHREFKGGLENESSNIALAAYVMVSLIEAGTIVRPSVIQSGSFCLQALHHSRDAPLHTYALALVAYAQARLEIYESEIRARNDINIERNTDAKLHKREAIYQEDKTQMKPSVTVRIVHGVSKLDDNVPLNYEYTEKQDQIIKTYKGTQANGTEMKEPQSKETRNGRKGENWAGADYALGELRSIARRSGDLVWWEAENLATSIESTAYAVMALLTRHRKHGPHTSRVSGGEIELEDAAGAVRWLSLHRNSAGGFVSTQDTLVAIEAITAWSTATVHIPPLMDIVVSGPDLMHQLSITPRTRHVLHSMASRPRDLTESLRVRAQGSGCVLVQATQHYHTLEMGPRSSSPFLLQSLIRSDGTFDCQNNETWCRCAAILEICISWMGEDFPEMAILEVDLPTGYIVDKTLLYGLLNGDNILLRRLEEWEIDSRVILYLAMKGSHREGRPHECYKIYLMGPQSKTAPARVRIYDYYHPEINATQSYTITESCPGRIAHPEKPDLGTDNLYRHIEERGRNLDANDTVNLLPITVNATENSHESMIDVPFGESVTIAAPSYAMPTNKSPSAEFYSSGNLIVTTSTRQSTSVSEIINEITTEVSSSTLSIVPFTSDSSKTVIRSSERPMFSDNPYQIINKTESFFVHEPTPEPSTVPSEALEQSEFSIFDNFHVVDSDIDLAVPDGIEGPIPNIVSPPPNYFWEGDLKSSPEILQPPELESASIVSNNCYDRFANWSVVTHDLEAAETRNLPTRSDLPCQT